jgi:hypothetical protein
MKLVEIYTDGEDGSAASMIKSRPARRLRGSRRTWRQAPSERSFDENGYFYENS